MNVLSRISRNSLGHVVTAEGFLVGISPGVFFRLWSRIKVKLSFFLPLAPFPKCLKVVSSQMKLAQTILGFFFYFLGGKLF